MAFFYKCTSLLSLPDISKWNTNNVINLININISSLFTKNLTNSNGIFYNYNNLINIDLSSFDTKNVENMNGILYDSNNYINIIIDLIFFDNKDVTNMNSMF